MDHREAPVVDAQMLFVSLDLDRAFGEPTFCVGCGAEDLVPVQDSLGMTFHCPACGQTWRAEMGTLVPIETDPRVPGPRRDEP